MASTSGSAPKKMKISQSETEEEESKEEYDVEAKKALEEFEVCQHQINVISEECSEEISKVEEKFNNIRKPFFEQRNEIIKRIPHFWATAFANHPQLSAILGEQQEEDCLHYLTKMEFEEINHSDLAYSITFHFDDNPYFENKALSKVFTTNPSPKCPPQNTIIRWKEGHDITKMYKEKHIKRRKRALEEETFFSWFSANDHLAHEIGELIKDDMWHNPLQYYLLPDLEEIDEHNISDDEGHDSIVSEMDEDEGDYEEEEEEMQEEDEGDYSEESERIEEEEEEA